MATAKKVVRRGGAKKAPVKKSSTPKNKKQKGVREGVIKYSDKIALPGVNVPPEDFLDYPVCIFGEKGIGKTSLAAQFPGALVFMFERGRRNLPIRQIPQRGEKPLDWERFKQYLELIAEDESIETPVIDTIDRTYEACYTYICHYYGVSSPEEAGKSKSTVWNSIREEAETVLNALIDIKGRVVFLSHAREQEMESRLGEAYKKVVPTASPMVWKYIQTCVDFVFYYGYYKSRRALNIRGYESLSSSCGPTDCFLDPNGELVNTISMGSSAEEAYANLIRGFQNELYDITKEEEQKKEAGKKALRGGGTAKKKSAKKKP